MPRIPAVSRRLRGILAVIGITAVPLASCVDGLRPRLNANDTEGDSRFELVAIKDTVSAVGDWALFYLKSNADGHNYGVVWTSDADAILRSEGSGRFRLLTLTGAPSQVKIRTSFRGVVDSAVVVIDP